jgi:MYXO-CTERM domain-containing protein
VAAAALFLGGVGLYAVAPGADAGPWLAAVGGLALLWALLRRS